MITPAELVEEAVVRAAASAWEGSAIYTNRPPMSYFY
jgi:hypothetical protein